ncbi:MAG TPA: TIGR03435 family protein [Bryobacteraceae bacterium]|jgi:uncharacterized protein (TIGR03435 family)
MVRTCILASGLFLCVWIAQGQNPAFEAASVKPNVSGQDGGSIGPRGNGLVATNVPLNSLLNFAYAPANGLLLKEQIANAPDWAAVDRFDIQAKLPGDPPGVPISQIRLALQALLADRFQLKVHREDRTLPVYNLVIFKGGPRLSADHTPPAPSFIQFSSADEQHPPLPRGAMRIISGGSGTTLEGSAIAVAKLVSLLQGQSDRIIFDKTGFTGLFDLHLEFTQPASTSQTTESSAPSLFTAIQEIGLKLESDKAPIEVFVIDSVHKPSGN